MKIFFDKQRANLWTSFFSDTRRSLFIKSTSEVKFDIIIIANEYLVGASDYNMVGFVDVQMEH